MSFIKNIMLLTVYKTYHFKAQKIGNWWTRTAIFMYLCHILGIYGI